MHLSYILQISYLAGYGVVYCGIIITGIASHVITFASPVAVKAFVAAGILGSCGVGIGVVIFGIAVGLAYNKLVNYINVLK